MDLNIVGCRYRSSAVGFTGTGLHSWHHRMSRLARVKVAREVTAELREAIAAMFGLEPARVTGVLAMVDRGELIEA